MKQFAVLIFLFAASVISAQQAQSAEAFRKLTTTAQRFAFLADSNVAKMDKPAYDAILPVIEAKKDDKTLFFWHFQYMRFAEQFKVFNAEMFPTILENMSNAAAKRGLDVESVVAQYHIAFDDFSNKKLSEQQVYSAFIHCFEKIRRLGIHNFRPYSVDQIFLQIGGNFYALGDYDKALECLLEAENLNKPKGYSSPHIHTLILNLIQSIYADAKNYPKAIAYAEKIYDFNLNNQCDADHTWFSTFWQGLSSLDIALYLFEMGNFEKGEKYADRGYAKYKAQEDINNPDKVVAAFDALYVLIKIKLKLGKLNEVEPLLKKVEFLKTHIPLSTEANYFKPLKLYQNYVNYYEAKKDYTNAFRYMKLVDELQDSLERRNDKRKLWQIESRVKADNYLSQIQSAEAENRLQERLRNLALITLVLFGAIAFVVYRRIKKDNQTITKQKTLLEQSLGEKENLLREIHHRIKNNLQVISGLFDKQSRQTWDETTRKLMKEGQDRVFSIALVHQNLYQSDNLTTIQIKSYLETLTKNIEKSQKSEFQDIALILDVDDSVLDIDTAIPLGLILNELITNCYKYAFKDRTKGEIQIRFYRMANEMVLDVQDNGVGLPQNFDIDKTKSLGINLVRGLVRQLDGKLDFTSSAVGTTFTICCINQVA